jgi:hypothetical protein
MGTIWGPRATPQAERNARSQPDTSGATKPPTPMTAAPTSPPRHWPAAPNPAATAIPTMIADARHPHFRMPIIVTRQKPTVTKTPDPRHLPALGSRMAATRANRRRPARGSRPAGCRSATPQQRAPGHLGAGVTSALEADRAGVQRQSTATGAGCCVPQWMSADTRIGVELRRRGPAPCAPVIHTEEVSKRDVPSEGCCDYATMTVMATGRKPSPERCRSQQGAVFLDQGRER